jgi:asparagine synthase (glutamine-hydrolysing)
MTSKLAAEHVSIVLSPEGADELFAGYQYMKQLPLAEVNEECRRCLSDLHHNPLQQADPVVEYFNLEMRAPFLDKDMISLAMKIPADLKIRTQQSLPQLSKWIFRQAFTESGLLPDDILWPAQVPQSQSASCLELAEEVAEAEIGEEEMVRLRADHPEAGIDTKETALYFKIFQGLAS